MKSLYCSHCGAVVLSEPDTTEAAQHYAMKVHQITCRQALQADAKSSQDKCPCCFTDCYAMAGKACSGNGIYVARKGGINTTQPQKPKINAKDAQNQTGAQENIEGELIPFGKAADEHADIAGGGWLRFEDGDEKIVKFVGEGLRIRDSNFTPKPGQERRKEYIADVEVDGTEMKWSFSVQSQHADKIVKGLQAGKRKFKIMRDGTGTNTRYVVKPL